MEQCSCIQPFSKDFFLGSRGSEIILLKFDAPNSLEEIEVIPYWRMKNLQEFLQKSIDIIAPKKTQQTSSESEIVASTSAVTPPSILLQSEEPEELVSRLILTRNCVILLDSENKTAKFEKFGEELFSMLLHSDKFCNFCHALNNLIPFLLLPNKHSQIVLTSLEESFKFLLGNDKDCLLVLKRSLTSIDTFATFLKGDFNLAFAFNFCRAHRVLLKVWALVHHCILK